MAKHQMFAVYGTDTDGSQRKWCTVRAKSAAHAVQIARKQEGIISYATAEPVAAQRTSEELRREIMRRC